MGVGPGPTGQPREVLRYEAHSSASVDEVWSLISQPDRWPEWSPHVRGAWRLGQPEVERGAQGAARLLGVVPIPARITAVAPGRSWTWRVAGIDMDHRVEAAPDGQGSIVGVDLRAAPAAEAVLRLTYGPVVQLLVKNLARVAAD